MCVFIFDGVGENVIEWSPLVTRNCLDVCELKKQNVYNVKWVPLGEKTKILTSKLWLKQISNDVAVDWNLIRTKC